MSWSNWGHREMGMTWTFSAEYQVREVFEEQVTKELFDEYVSDAEAYPPSPSPEERDRFMIGHGYSEADAPENF